MPTASSKICVDISASNLRRIINAKNIKQNVLVRINLANWKYCPAAGFVHIEWNMNPEMRLKFTCGRTIS
jgi:hypothetical protein